MRNVFNYMTVYHEPAATADAITAALAAGLRINPRIPHLNAVMFALRDDDARADLLQSDPVGDGIVRVITDGADDAMETDEVFAHLYPLELDAALLDERAAHLAQWYPAVAPWRWVYVSGEEPVEYDVDGGGIEVVPTTLHSGWLAYAAAPEGGVYIANAITDPFLFYEANALTTTRSEDLHAYIVNGTRTLAQVFVAATGCAPTPDIEPVRCVIGYSSHESALDEETVARIYNLSWLQNASTTRMGTVQTSWGITVARLYAVLRHSFHNLTASCADLHFRPTWYPGTLVQLDASLWTHALAEHVDEDDADTVETVWDEMYGLLGDDNYLIPHMVIPVEITDTNTLRGVPYSESQHLHEQDASKWLLSHITQALVGVDYALFSVACDMAELTPLEPRWRESAPSSYTNARTSGDAVDGAAVLTYTLPVEYPTAPDYPVRSVTLQLDPARLPPWTALRIIPTIMSAPIAALDDARLVAKEEFEDAHA